MKRTLLFLLFGMLSAQLLFAGTVVRLFNGKTFDGWTGDTNRSFRIEDGAIVGGNLKSNIPRNEFLRTTRAYTNFVLRLKFKLIGANANGGVQFRTQSLPGSNEVSGYQADMGDPGWWGCLYDESRRNKVLAASHMNTVKKVLRHDGWNDYRIRCEGQHIEIWLNGLKTVDYTEADPAIPASGIFAVQIHAGGPSEAWYKDFRLEVLP